ncbi:MAG: Maltose transport system permease protein MalF [Alphaproteobacteria bacterium MarineAlpha9_Bin3]|nr:MAG: Maltose transport system permease protein MalF [Alphaproteobacteria bacterium MarineAlpha9_Bin3]|tara:strand:- start:2551 stop:3438 length:888 start_codon:yes stop_codon:yes gene_type:complete
MKINNLFVWLKQKPRIAFFMCLPLILMVACLIIYPFFYSIFLATLNKAETKFVGLANFLFLFKRETFWLVVQQSIFFALVAVFFKALIGFIAAHSINELPSKGQRKWRGMLLIPWVIPPALSTLGWWWLFEPTYSALNWLLEKLSVDAIPWLSETFWARFSIILVNIWVGAPFFLIMYLAALKSIPEDLYEAASIDGANYWQKLFFITLPMMKNIISITILFSIIVTFANFDIVRVLTRGGPIDTTHLFATYAFRVGIESGDIPLGAAVSLFMFPVLAVLSFIILRNVRKRTNEV